MKTPHRTLTPLFVAAATLLVVSTIFTFLVGRKVIHATQTLLDHQALIHQLGTLLSTCKDAETGVRGFIITGEAPYLEPYQLALQQLPVQLAALRLQEQAHRLPTQETRRLDTLAQQSLAYLNEGIQVRRSQGREAAANFIRSGKGKQIMDAIRLEVASLTAAEQQTLQTLSRQASQATHIRSLTFALTSAVNLLFLLWIFGRIRSEIQRRELAILEANHQKETLRTTLASIGDAVVVTDPQGKITFLNAEAEHLTAWSRQEALGAPLAQVFRIINESTRQPVESPVDKVLRSGAVVGLANHTLLLARNGRELPIDDSAAPIRQADGSCLGVVLVFRDFTHQKEAERQLRDSEERYRATCEHAAIGIEQVSLQGRLLEVNPALCSLLGYSRQELLARRFIDITEPEDLKIEQPLIAQLLQGQIPSFCIEKRYIRKDGSRVWIRINSSLAKTTNPYRISIIEDISALKQAELELRRQREWLSVTLSSIGDAVLATDAEGKISFLNPVAATLTGWTQTEALGRPAEEVFHILNEQTRQTAPSIVEHVLREKKIIGLANHTALLSQQGHETPIEDSAAPILDETGRVLGTVLVFHDVTTKRQAELILEQSRQRLAWVLEHTGVGLWFDELPLNELDWDSQTRQLFFVGPEEKATINLFFSRLHPQDVERTRRAIDQALQNHTLYEIDHRAVDPRTGQLRWVRSIGQATYGPDGTPRRFDGINYDITAAKNAEKALRESEQLYRAIGESIDFGVWVCDPQGRNIYASPSFLKLVGLTQRQCSDFGWGDVLHPDDTERTIAAWKECVRTQGSWDIEHRFRGVDGKWHPVLARGLAVRDEQGQVTCWAGINLDISRQKQTEQELTKAQAALKAYAENLEKTVQERTTRLTEMISELQHVSYAMVHDMRAPLRAMSGFALTLQEECSQGSFPPEAQEYCRRILSGAGRLDKLITDGLNYTKSVLLEVRMQPVALEPLLNGLLQTYPNLHPDNADIQLDGALPTVLGNESLLTQCFSNLLGNAVKFMPPGKRPQIHIRAVAQGAMARILVQDNGIGISEMALPRLFGMFQKLDNQYEGTGIGLAIVRKVIERMGGKVGAESVPGQGSCFWVELPLAGDRG